MIAKHFAQAADVLAARRNLRASMRAVGQNMQSIAYPMAFGHWHLHNDQLVCRMPRKTVVVAAPAGLLKAVLELCNGRMAWREVAATLGRRWRAGPVEAFLSQLSQEGALVEAGEALACWTDIAQFPTPFPKVADREEACALQRVAQDRLLPGRGEALAEAPQQAEALADLLRRRESHRTFADAPMPARALASILWAAHGVARPCPNPTTRWHRTIASGGNLHSTRWFVVVLRPLPWGEADRPALPPGLYEARFHLEGGVSFDPRPAATEHAWRVLLDPRPLTFASVLVIPVCDVALPARKYGNRATLFASLEVGQSLQNAQLMATALNVGCSVRGDTSAQAVRGLLGPELAPGGARAAQALVLPCLLAGMQATAAESELQRRSPWLTMGHATALPAASSSDGAAPAFAFFAGPVRLGTSEVYASGRSIDPREALNKAEAEAWERRGWATLGPTIEGAAHDLADALDPRCYVAYSAQQHQTAGFPCAPFFTRRKYAWAQGCDTETGGRVLLPAECVHALSALPERFRRHPCTNSSTSGVAAWTDAEGALCKATLELVERDAFLRSWLSRGPAPRVATDSLPAAARRRIDALEQLGHRAAVLRPPSALAPVYAVFVQSTRRPFTAITAAADFDAEAALGKALDEAEGRAAHAAAYPAQPITRLRDVACIEDINRLYQSPRFYRRADFYAAGPASERFGAVAGVCQDWNAVKRKLHEAGKQLLAFDLTPAGASIQQGRKPLRVLRAVIPGLLPIWFQHGLEPAGLAAFQRAAVREGGPARAVCIHPFV